MALRKVPGVRNYWAEDKGFKEIALGKPMGQNSLRVAKQIAANAEQRGFSGYEARPEIVRAGWEHERRRGAIVSEKEADWRDARNRVLLRTLQAMTIRKERRR